MPVFCCAALGPDAVQAILQHYPTPLHLHRAYKVLRRRCCLGALLLLPLLCAMCWIGWASMDTRTSLCTHACRRLRRQQSAVARTGSVQRSASCTASSPTGELLLPALRLLLATCT